MAPGRRLLQGLAHPDLDLSRLLPALVAEVCSMNCWESSRLVQASLDTDYVVPAAVHLSAQHRLPAAPAGKS